MSIYHTTRRGEEIYVMRGKKSASDFVVKYKLPPGRLRTPKHIHWIIDLMLKREHNPEVANQLAQYFLVVAQTMRATSSFPPKLQYYKPSLVKHFRALDRYGDYSVEFLLVAVELILIQEKTNYPTGIMSVKLLKAFLANKDIFGIVSKASFRTR